ncbi:MAG: response regulator transcription factor [Fimbriimonadaceae bacterium]|nr:response regulator transcription factor [Fimbriimonadaceae bacterium]QYK55989.1 MAG: response regulator transcription factor [Fimbriimonadaceae bacterium]
MTILVVDDEQNILETVENKLRKEGYTTFSADTAEEAMRLFKLVKPDLILLDVMLPQRSGFELCRALRRVSNVPIIFLTARLSEEDRVQGLDLGADDYVVKPFSLSELVARIRSVLRRSSGDHSSGIIESGRLKIDPRTHEVWVDGEPVSFSPREFALLHFLARHSGQVFSRETLLDRVWEKESYVSPRTVDVHVRWLRERIEPDASKPSHLVTVRGVGYKFVG